MSGHNNRNLEPRYSKQPPPGKSGEQIIRQHNPIQQQTQPLRNLYTQMADSQKGGEHRFQSEPQHSICIPNPSFPNLQQPAALPQTLPPPAQHPQHLQQAHGYPNKGAPRHSMNRNPAQQPRQQLPCANPYVQMPMQPLGAQFLLYPSYQFYSYGMMQQRPGLQQQDPNVNVMAPETHYANQHAYPQQYMNAQLRQHPPQIPLAMNKYSPQPQQHQMPMATPQQQQQQQQQPPVQKTPRPRIAAKIVDPATNKELNIADLASDKSNVTSNEVSKDTSAAAASNKSIGNTAEDSKPSIAVPSESNKPSVGSTSDATKPEPKQPVAAAEAKDSSSVTGSTITATATTNSSVAPESTTASNVQQVQKPAPTVIEHKTAEVKTAGGSVHPQSAKISKPAANAVSSQSHHHPQIESNSKSQPESVAVAKSQPDHNLAVSTAIETPMSKAASAAIAGKSTPINSSPPEAKSANVSPAYGRSSVTAATNASPILSSAKEPEVVETSKPEVQSNSAPSEAIGDQPTMNQLADSKAVGDDDFSPVSFDSKLTKIGVATTDQHHQSQAQVTSKPKSETEAPKVIPSRDQSAAAKQPEEPSSDHQALPNKRSASEECKPGKYSYNAQFLKELQFNQFSVQKPNLPDHLNIVRQHPNPAQRPSKPTRSSQEMPDVTTYFVPGYMPGGSSLSRSGRNSIQGGGRMHIGQDSKQPRKIISTSLSQDVRLRTVENAWKPTSKKETQSGDDKTRELLSRARGLLNKLTPDNYQRIQAQILELELNTKDRLMKMLDLIFDKAIDEPAFCVQYASVCKAMIEISAPDENGELHKFGRLLLNKCQSMFEGEMYKDIDIEKREAEIKDCTDPEKKRQMFEELDEEKRLARKKSLGNIKLIGELNRLKMLSLRVMCTCISHLLKIGHDESYECLCTLLRSIGQALERDLSATQAGKSELSNWFAMLHQVTRQNAVSSRIRFMILDLLELRDNKWVPRKGQEGGKPKTIKEIHNDARKQDQAQAQISQRRSMNDHDRDYQNKGGSREFNLTMSRKSQSRDMSSILKNLNMASNQMMLGDHSKFSKFSSGARSQPSTAVADSSPSPANRYSGSSGSKDRWQRVGSGASTSIEKTKTTPDDDFKTFGSKSSQKRSPSPPLVKRLDEAAIESKLKAFLAKPDQAAIKTLREELNHIHPEDQKTLADMAVNKAIEVLRNQPVVADLFTYIFIKPSTLDLTHLIELMKKHLEAEDVRMDVPKYNNYIGTILSKIFLKAPNDELRTVFIRILDHTLHGFHAIDIMRFVLFAAVTSSSQEVVAQRWNAANLTWGDFTDNPDLLEKYKKDPELQFLSGNKSSSNLSSLVNEISAQFLKDDFKLKPEQLEKYKKTLSAVCDQPDIVSALLPFFLENAYQNWLGAKEKAKSGSLSDTFFKTFEAFCQILFKLKPEQTDPSAQLKWLKIVIDFNVSVERPKDLLAMAIEAMFDRFLIDASNLDALKNDKQVSYLDQLVITKLRDSFGPSETGQSRLG